MIFLMGRQKIGIAMTSLQRMPGIENYKTGWTMGHKIRKAMSEGDAQYELTGLIKNNHTYFDSPEPGKRGRGAAGKVEVVVALEVREDNRLKAHGFLKSGKRKHQPVVVGSGKNAVKVLPWIHIMIANVKRNIRGICHGVSSRHINHYLFEFCYRFNHRFREPQIFDRLLPTGLNCPTITFSKLMA